jgi:hypothetical protein
LKSSGILKEKFRPCIPVYKEYLPKLNLEIIPLSTREEIKKCVGATAAEDVPVLVSALNGKADFLVTGDKKDFPHSKEKVRCLSG